MRTNIRSWNGLRVIVGLLLCLGSHLNSFGAEGQSRARAVTGLWRTEDGVSIVEIRRCGYTLCGYLVSFSPVVDDPKANAELCNLQILGGFRQNNDQRWVDGWIVDPEDEQAHRVELTPDEADTLEVRAGDGLFVESVVWHREEVVGDRCAPAR